MKILKLLSLLMALSLIPGMACAETNLPATQIILSDSGVLVNGEAASADPSHPVYTANDIIYYESGRDFTYGDGKASDAHDPEAAAAHTVVHISQPGVYSVSGVLSKGQIAVDLGEDAKDDPKAVVNLILNGAEIGCEVAPAIIFYNVYECGSKDEKTASKDVDTSAAGANILIAGGSKNIVSGSYVADIYDPATLEIEDGEVEDAEKLHSYDGAVYSRMSMNIGGAGALEIRAENEGLCSELHLTLNGGDIRILSGNDGVNANEDNLSVVTVNSGSLQIQVTGETGEGDGIDSNGWIVINGGAVLASACADSADSGIDADMGIHIYGGDVISAGNMLDHIQDGGQNYAVFSFAEKQQAGQELCLKDESGNTQVFVPENDYSVLVYSAPDLAEGTYTLWNGDAQLSGRSGMSMGGFGRGFGGRAFSGERPDFDRTPDFKNMPQPPEGMAEFDKLPKGEMPGRRGFGGKAAQDGEASTEFKINPGANQFAGIASIE